MRTFRDRALRLASFLAAPTLIVLLLCGIYRELFYKPARDPLAYPKIQAIEPPEQGFFTKELSYRGIGRHQVTTDLPEWRHDKHVPLEEEHGLTRDERTRGMGGLMTSCFGTGAILVFGGFE